LQFNAAKINLPELNQVGYLDASGKDAMDVLQSKRGSKKVLVWYPASTRAQTLRTTSDKKENKAELLWRTQASSGAMTRQDQQ